MLNQVACGDCLSLIPQLPNNSINAVITSPPYAQQRKSLYEGVSEAEFPTWMNDIMTALRPKMTETGSVLIVIRSHIRDGEVSDYVMRTRLKIRESGWKECEELIWLKPDAPPLGSTKRPRRTWENILWFSPTNKPFVDLLACGNANSNRIGFQGSQRFGLGGTSPIQAVSQEVKSGVSKVSDVFLSNVTEIDKGVMHPAMYPATLCSQLILTFSQPGETILDPFAGSGTTLLVARTLKRNFIGFDVSQEYVDLATDRLTNDIRYPDSNACLDIDWES